MKLETMFGKLLVMLWLLPRQIWAVGWVDLPGHYTAMKGDLGASFALDINSTHLKSFNAMIHLEYLPKDYKSSLHIAR